jgi:methionyl aminopeptidase
MRTLPATLDQGALRLREPVRHLSRGDAPVGFRCRRLPAAAIGDNAAMGITIKTPEEIEKMRVAGRLAAEVLQLVAAHVKPGVTTEELDRICHEHIVNVQGATPANVGYKGYPKATCISANNVICHGIPSAVKVL